MTYKETLEYLFSQVPMYQRVGAQAYKPGLDTARRLDDLFHNPHRNYLTVHVAGTNGKGSVSHTIASILQLSGYRVGLYTSPHLIDFRERIRVDGEMISESEVVDFVEQYRQSRFEGQPSFFELTMTMAFHHFARRKVDIAVIEVGLGGRLDSTNIISPILSVITNISPDHTQFLGDTLPQIAAEKAGIIKSCIPVVVGEAQGDVREVFERKALAVNAPITFAQDNPIVLSVTENCGKLLIETTGYGTLTGELAGYCQSHNANTTLHAIAALRQTGVNITPDAVAQGFAHVCEVSGLMGRWMQVGTSPRVICDTGHNIGGFRYIARQLTAETCTCLHIVIGFVGDKDVGHILPLLPQNARYYFTQASIPRAMPSERLASLAKDAGLRGRAYDTVAQAYAEARAQSTASDTIFVGGSTFVVADFLVLSKAGLA